MNKRSKAFVSCAVALGMSLCFGCAGGCGTNDSDKDVYKNVNKSLLYGIDEPLTEGYSIELQTAETSQVTGFSLEKNRVSRIRARRVVYEVPHSGRIH